MHDSHVSSQKPNLLNGEREVRVLVNRVEYSLVPIFDRGAAFDVHPVDNDVVRIVGERLGENCAYTSLAGQPLFRATVPDD
jgi:hypothetical protein